MKTLRITLLLFAGFICGTQDIEAIGKEEMAVANSLVAKYDGTKDSVLQTLLMNQRRGLVEYVGDHAAAQHLCDQLPQEKYDQLMVVVNAVLDEKLRQWKLGKWARRGQTAGVLVGSGLTIWLGVLAVKYLGVFEKRAVVNTSWKTISLTRSQKLLIAGCCGSALALGALYAFFRNRQVAPQEA